MARTKSVQRTIYLTPEIQERLDQLLSKRGREVSQNDLIREALRYYLDNQEDILGSRRHFQKSLQEHVDKLETHLSSTTVQTTLTSLFYANVLLQLVASSMATVLSAITRERVDPKQLIQRAIIEARKEEQPLGAQIDAVRELRIPE
jgi:Arc/MetJ-type ribon-helix-helix transcriptional regulator